MRIACAVSSHLDADVYSAASAALVNLGETTLKQLQHGKLKEIIVRGDEGYTILTRAGKSYMVVGSCKIGSRMGYYLALLHRFCKKIEKILESEGGTQFEESISSAQTAMPSITPTSSSTSQLTQNQKPARPSMPSYESDKAAIESALSALSMLEESEPPGSVANQEPISINHAGSLDENMSSISSPTVPTSETKVDIDTDALIEALRQKTPSESTTSQDTSFSSTFKSSTTSGTNDLFNISDKEAVLEALKVLGWEEDENE